jgi:hypothetical protein
MRKLLHFVLGCFGNSAGFSSREHIRIGSDTHTKIQ